MLKVLMKNGLVRFLTKDDIKWPKVVQIVLLHVMAVTSIYFYVHMIRMYTIIWSISVGNFGGFGITGGAHRLWTHRSYKAKLPLRILLIICFVTAGQNSLYQWVRDHRIHHKYSETDADPHNANRGFFFAHVGWLMKQKHPEVLRRGREIYMDDILADPVVAFQQKYFVPMKILFCFLLPVIVPPLFWNETWLISFLCLNLVRYSIGLNFTWLVNSAAHLWGNKPYNRNIMPAENRTVSFVALGEGWHNYHHVFPWDYKAEELGNYSAYMLNFTTFLIDLFASIGWAYDRKFADSEVIRRIVEKKGDGSHEIWGNKSKIDQSEDNPLRTPIEIWDAERIAKSQNSCKIEEIKEEDSHALTKN